MTTALPLSEDHYEELIVRSAILPDVVAGRGYRTLEGSAEDRQFLEDAGYGRNVWDRDDAYPMLLVPSHGADGEVNGYQVKPAVPRSRVNGNGEPKPIKYETPKGAPLVVDLPPRSLELLRRNESQALWITEGLKKVDALVSYDCAAVGLSGVFNFRNRLGTLGDWEDVPIKGRPAVICFDADAENNRNVQLAMARLGAWLKSRGASKVHYLVVPAQVGETDVKGVDDFFAAGGTLADLFEAARDTPPGVGMSADDASFTDAYLADKLCEDALEGHFCWAAGLGWLMWDGRVWVEISDVKPTDVARQWAQQQFECAADRMKREASSKDAAAKVAAWRGVLARNRITNLIGFARGILLADAADFDGDPDILNVTNGILDLRTGILSPHDPSYLCTKMADAEYRPGARHPLWDKALTAVPTTLHEWLADRLGQSLTGYKTPDHVMVLSYGSGSNGKSTVTATVRRTIGTYGVQISDRVLMANPGDHPTELMDLRGARYAVLEETPEARQLNVQRLKATVGTPEMTARRIRQDSVTFKTTHSMFVNTNYKPQVNETDHGTWRRLALLTYPYTFQKRADKVIGPFDRLGDPGMEYAHDDPDVRSAALSWMVAGARAWYARGRRMLEIPEMVENDTKEWRAETDLIMGFVDERLKLRAEAFTAAADLLTAFNEWAGERGHRPWNDKTFANRFGGHDVTRGAKVSQGRKYVGGRQVRGWHGVEIDTGDNPFDAGWAEPEPDPEPEGEPFEASSKTVQNHPETSSAQVSGSVSLGFDLETASVSELYTGGHEGPFVRLSGAHDNREKAVWQRAEPLLDELNCADEIYGANILGFDLQALAHHHGADFDALAAKAVDLTVRERLLDPPGAKGTTPKGYYGLDAMAQRYGVAGKTHDLKALADKHGGYDRVPLNDPEYNDYLRGDLTATKAVKDAQDARMAKQPEVQQEYARREMRVQALLNRMPLNGWRVDVPELALRVEREAVQRAEAIALLHTDYGMPTHKPDRFKLKPKAEWPENLRQMSVAGVRDAMLKDPEQAVRVGVAERIPGEELAKPWTSKEGRPAIVEAFRKAGAPYYPTTKTGDIKLSKDALGEGMWYDPDRGEAVKGMLHPEAYGSKPEVRELVNVILQATGAREKYAEIARFVTDAGRVHPVLSGSRPGQGGGMDTDQAAGRFALAQPSLTNMGKRGQAAQERGVLVAEEGHLLVTCDASQVDVRAVAGHCQDPVLIGMLQPGQDYHTEMALIFFNDASRRSDGKPISHGRNYGQGWRAIAERNGLDHALVRNACALQDAKMPVLLDWKGKVAGLAASGALLDNGFGRLMRPDPARAATQGPALMGQGAARDIVCESLLRMVERDRRATQYIRGVVHDEVILSVPEADVQYWQELVEDAFTWEWRGVPILCDLGTPAYRWSDCK